MSKRLAIEQLLHAYLPIAHGDITMIAHKTGVSRQYVHQIACSLREQPEYQKDGERQVSPFENEQKDTLGKRFWTGALVRSSYTIGDHLLWVTKTTHGLNVTFVQVIAASNHTSIGEDAKPISYRMADFNSLFLALKNVANRELYTWARARMWQYLREVYGEKLETGWYYCDDPVLVEQATYREWEQYMEHLRHLAMKHRRWQSSRTTATVSIRESC